VSKLGLLSRGIAVYLIFSINVMLTDRLHDTEMQDGRGISCVYWRFADGRLASHVWSSSQCRHHV